LIYQVKDIENYGKQKGNEKTARANETSPGFELNHKHVLLVLLGFLMLFFS